MLSDSGDMESIYIEHVAGAADLVFQQHIVSLSKGVKFLKMTAVLIYSNGMNPSDPTFN